MSVYVCVCACALVRVVFCAADSLLREQIQFWGFLVVVQDFEALLNASGLPALAHSQVNVHIYQCVYAYVYMCMRVCVRTDFEAF